ncbi:MAG: ABC transporter ATP-binding protein [SAR202 cluster bacterium]|nr:ABC transporter ATP-binding protein [SAR202 cluster bacterium]
MAKVLEVKDLATYFFTADGVVKAVDGISYHVDEGESIAIVGESGCGKSVSALSVMRLVASPPGRTVHGEVVFEGQDILKLSESEMRHVRGNRIGMVFQEPMTSLNPVLSIGYQLTESLMLHLGMTRVDARERAGELLNLVGIPDAERRLKDYPHQFSGGMRQRVMIALALSCNPKIIIADEPTTALDVTIQAQVLEVMKSLADEFGTALIMITHNLGVVARYAQRVIVMYAGKIIESGSAKQIYGDPRHPYTLGLLKSVPRLDESRKEKLDPIEGLPPLLINLPAACSFAPRCKYAIDKCRSEVPQLEMATDGHVSACFRSKELAQLAKAHA